MINMAYAINEIVSKIGNISIEGNVIPNEWYTHLRNENGKFHSIAAIILADIVYWYRPIPIYDITTKQVIGFGKKFKEDHLQAGYKYFNEKFGLTESQTRSALVFLEKNHLIFREFRNIIVTGQVVNNVMYIGINPENISKITKSSNNDSVQISALPSFTNNVVTPTSLQHAESANTILSPVYQNKPKEKDWSAKFTDEQKAFLDYLLNIKPEIGEPIEKNHATWWIKSFGIEKIKIALQVYWQRIEIAKQDSTTPIPQNIGKYVRKALNDGLVPVSLSVVTNNFLLPPCSEKNDQVAKKTEPGALKNSTTNTQISMTYLLVNEVNDKRASMTFQKEERDNTQKKEVKEFLSIKDQTQSLFSSKPLDSETKTLKKSNSQIDWKETFTAEEKKYLSYLLRVKPEIGDSIEEKHATWWIKNFGVEKVKIALLVYWQQVDKSKKNINVPLPKSLGAYVRDALNKGTQPCREIDKRNKVFAEKFKKQMGWSALTITEKYCRADDLGKDWYYNMPEALFVDSLKETFENYYGYPEKKNCAA